jgi:hypothetical protein
MLAVGDKAPELVVASLDDREVVLGSPDQRIALWFSPKGGLIDEIGDKLVPSLSP